MLAFMPQSTSLTELHTPPLRSTSTMSLAILPSSPMTCGQAPSIMLSSHITSPSKRPKLSLNTMNAAPTFGKKSTSLRLETLSATSPTAVNTFSNGYEAEKSLKTTTTKPKRPSLAVAVDIAPAIPNSFTPVSLDPSESTGQFDSTSLSAVSVSSVSSAESTSTEPPYKLSCNIDSILRNGPIPRTRGSQRTAFAQPRAMFPSKKYVTFKACLTEEIYTSKYVLKNSDIAGPSANINTLELSSREEGEAMKNGAISASTMQGSEMTMQHTVSGIASPQIGDKRESSDEEDSDTCPQTPVAGRQKRSRQWRWTLDPVGPSHCTVVDAGAEAEDEDDD